MYVKTLNKISSKGLDFLTDKGFSLNSDNPAQMLLLRSQKLSISDIDASMLVVARAGVGVNNIPVEELTQLGIPVLNTPGANAPAVRDLVFGSLICVMRNIIKASTELNSKDINNIESIKKKFCGSELSNKKITIVGLGAIGKLVAKTAISFGMEVLGFDPMISEQDRKNLTAMGIKLMPALELGLAQADIITFHVPLTKQTSNIINSENIMKLKDKVTIINFSRPGIVSDNAILNSNKAAYYITDFPSAECLKADNVLCLPHLGASTQETEEQCSVIAAKHAWRYLAYGEISNSVNFPNIKLYQPESHRIALIHKNSINMLSQITSVIGARYNIDQLHNASKNEIAYTVLDLSENICPATFKQIQAIEGMIRLRKVV